MRADCIGKCRGPYLLNEKEDPKTIVESITMEEEALNDIILSMRSLPHCSSKRHLTLLQH
jgi:hypothetical protein